MLADVSRQNDITLGMTLLSCLRKCMLCQCTSRTLITSGSWHAATLFSKYGHKFEMAMSSFVWIKKVGSCDRGKPLIKWSVTICKINHCELENKFIHPSARHWAAPWELTWHHACSPSKMSLMDCGLEHFSDMKCSIIVQRSWVLIQVGLKLGVRGLI